MFENILNRLNNIEGGYNAAIDVANGIFNKVKTRNFKELPDLTKFQTELMMALKNEKALFKKEIAEFNDRYGIKGAKLQPLLPMLPQHQKEIILDLVKKLSVKESMLEKSLFQNKQYLEALVSVQQAMVDSVLEIGNEKKQDNNFLLNKKF